MQISPLTPAPPTTDAELALAPDTESCVKDPRIIVVCLAEMTGHVSSAMPLAVLFWKSSRTPLRRIIAKPTCSRPSNASLPPSIIYKRILL